MEEVTAPEPAPVCVNIVDTTESSEKPKENGGTRKKRSASSTHSNSKGSDRVGCETIKRSRASSTNSSDRAGKRKKVKVENVSDTVTLDGCTPPSQGSTAPVVDAGPSTPSAVRLPAFSPASSTAALEGAFVCVRGVVHPGGTLTFEHSRLVCDIPDGTAHTEDLGKIIGIWRLRECDRVYWIKLKAAGKGNHENRVIIYGTTKSHPMIVHEISKSGINPNLLHATQFCSKEKIEKLGKSWDQPLLNAIWQTILSIIRRRPYQEQLCTPSQTPIPPRRFLSVARSADSRRGNATTPLPTNPRATASAPPRTKPVVPELVIPDGERLRLDGAQLVQADICRLSADEFLNDACINFFIKFLTIFLVPKFPHVKKKFFAFTTYFFSQLIAFDSINGESGHANVRRWTKALQKEVGSAGLFAQDWVAVPINQSNVHWWLALIIRPALGDTAVAVDVKERSEVDKRPIRRTSPNPSDGDANAGEDKEETKETTEKQGSIEPVAKADDAKLRVESHEDGRGAVMGSEEPIAERCVSAEVSVEQCISPETMEVETCVSPGVKDAVSCMLSEYVTQGVGKYLSSDDITEADDLTEAGTSLGRDREKRSSYGEEVRLKDIDEDECLTFSVETSTPIRESEDYADAPHSQSHSASQLTLGSPETIGSEVIREEASEIPQASQSIESSAHTEAAQPAETAQGEMCDEGDDATNCTTLQEDIEDVDMDAENGSTKVPSEKGEGRMTAAGEQPAEDEAVATPQTADSGPKSNDDVKVVDAPPKEAEKVDLNGHDGPLILLLDSAAEQPAEENAVAAEFLKGYLRQEWFSCGQVTDFDTSKVAVRKVKTPKQKNGVDCGVFVIEYLIRFIHDGNLLDNVLTADPSSRNFGFAQDRCTKRREQLHCCSQKMVVEALKTNCWDTREMMRRNPDLLHEIFELLFAEKPAPRGSSSAPQAQGPAETPAPQPAKPSSHANGALSLPVGAIQSEARSRCSQSDGQPEDERDAVTEGMWEKVPQTPTPRRLRKRSLWDKNTEDSGVE